MRFTIDVANKIAVPLNPPEIICGNSDYIIDFTFDDEWNDYELKTARFTFKLNGQNVYKEVLFRGTSCGMPILSNITEVYVGVYAGELSTTTPAKLICKKSILCSTSMHKDPSEDVYIQILNLLQNNYPVENAIKLAEELEKLEDFKSSIELIVQEYPATSMYMKQLYDNMQANLSGDVIWTNPDTTVQFKEQTISMDLTEYKRFDIIFKCSIDNETYYNHSCNRKNVICRYYAYMSSNGSTYRDIAINNSEILFYNSYAPVTSENKYMIPVEIIGYKY